MDLCAPLFREFLFTSGRQTQTHKHTHKYTPTPTRRDDVTEYHFCLVLLLYTNCIVCGMWSAAVIRKQSGIDKPFFARKIINFGCGCATAAVAAAAAVASRVRHAICNFKYEVSIQAVLCVCVLCVCVCCVCACVCVWENTKIQSHSLWFDIVWRKRVPCQFFK